MVSWRSAGPNRRNASGTAKHAARLLQTRRGAAAFCGAPRQVSRSLRPYLAITEPGAMAPSLPGRRASRLREPSHDAIDVGFDRLAIHLHAPEMNPSTERCVRLEPLLGTEKRQVCVSQAQC